MLESTYSDQHGWPPLLGLESFQAAPLLIESIEMWAYRGTYLVRCRSRDGVVGVATANARAPYLGPMFNGLVAPFFIGRDARQLETLVNEVYTFKNNYKYQGTPLWNCVAYIEAALFDLLGKACGRSVSELIGGARRRHIPVYLSSLTRQTTPEEEVDWVGRRLQETNAGAVKLKVGGRMNHNADAMPGRSETLIRLARERFGPETVLYVDANGSYDHVKAIEVGQLLEEYDYSFFEEPCPCEQYEETQAVADALDIDVAGGEQDCNMGHFRAMIRQRTVDVVQPDMMYNGGLIRALRVGHMAAEAGIPVTPHSPKHNPEMATLLHFAAAVGHTGPYMEFPARPVEYEDWYAPAFRIQDGGLIEVPQGPGLGVSYDDSIWDVAEKV
jgi:L-alanine-DL-glutamate epimerase-like enolase superfamily enzyme